MSRWKENACPLPVPPRGSSNPSPLLPCKRPPQSPCPPPPRRPLANVTGNALQQRGFGSGGGGGGAGCGYGYSTPLPKVPKSCRFLLDDDDMDEAFLREVDAICEEHARSTARNEKDKHKKSAEDPNETGEGSVAAAMNIDAGPENGTLEDDAFWKEVNAICEERDAQSAAKSQEELNEAEQEESSVLPCDDDSLPPVISIAAEGGEFEDAFWKVNAINEEHHAKFSAKCQEEMEAEEEDGSVALCSDASVPPVISVVEGGGELVDAFLGEVDAFHEGHAALSAAKVQEDPGEMELEMEEDEGCIPRKYYEYLHSLTTGRGRLHSNVVIPLMIVAGLGSGKVLTTLDIVHQGIDVRLRRQLNSVLQAKLCLDNSFKMMSSN